MSILAADVKVWVKARFSDKRLLDLTNQDIRDADDINDARLSAAIEDADLIFETSVGDETSDKYKHDKGSLIYLTMFYLYVYAGESQHANYYLSTAQEFMIQSLKFRMNIEMVTPDEQTDMEFANRKNMIDNIPKPNSSQRGNVF